MKTYLSEYWRRSIVFIVGMMIFMLAGVTVFVALSELSEDYVIVILILWDIIIITFCLASVYGLLRYTIIEDNRIIEYSFFGKELRSLDLGSPVYFDIKPMIEGMLSTKEFAVISSMPFKPYRYDIEKRLGIISKRVNKAEEQIIIPRELFDRIYNANNFIYVS